MNNYDDNHIDLNDKVILITGGTGSFGKEFTRIVSENYKPKKLIIFSRDEMKQYEMAQLYGSKKYPYMRYFIGDVRDLARLEMAMRDVDYVIHAAALKHVPIAEYNPFECIHTNVLGAENIVRAAIKSNVKKVIALSTDKAVNPANLYGASKLASDKIFVAANSLSGDQGTRFSIVRYGNVVGSRGSVVPLFKKIFETGKDKLPITDVRMTRFWITLGKSVNFVLSSLSIMEAGEIFVPKLPSMKLVDLANVIAPGVKQEIVGIRPGEKLHEILITEQDAVSTIEMPDRFIITPNSYYKHDKWSSYDNSLVPEDFSYSSNNNDVWLKEDQLKEIINTEIQYK